MTDVVARSGRSSGHGLRRFAVLVLTAVAALHAALAAGPASASADTLYVAPESATATIAFDRQQCRANVRAAYQKDIKRANRIGKRAKKFAKRAGSEVRGQGPEAQAQGPQADQAGQARARPGQADAESGAQALLMPGCEGGPPWGRPRARDAVKAPVLGQVSRVDSPVATSGFRVARLPSCKGA